MADCYSIITHRNSVPYTYHQRQQLLLFKRVTTNQLAIDNIFRNAPSHWDWNNGSLSWSFVISCFCSCSHPGVALVLLHEWVVELLEARHYGREVFLCWKDSCPKVEHPVFREKQQIHHFSNVLSDFLLCCCYLQTTEENRSNMSQKILIRI